MKYILLDGVVQNAGTKDFKELVGKVTKELGLSLPGYCCNSDAKPSSGQVLSWDSTLNRYVPVTASGVTSVTNLSLVANATNNVVSNSNGTGFTIPLVTTSLAGLATPAMFSALSASTPTNAQMGVGNTYVAVTDPATGTISFVVDGITQMTISQGKITTSSFFDPSAVGFTKMTQAQAATVTGALFNDSIYVDSVTNHLFRGSKDLEANTGTITSVFGRSTAAIVATNGDYTASQVTNVPSGSISAITVQDALNELDTEKIGLTSPLTGLTLASSADITATDTIIGAFGKLQAQLDLTSTAALADSNIFVGNASNVAVGVPMSGQATITNAGAVTLDNAAVIGKVLTGFVSGAGVITATDSILQSIQKLDGNSKVDATETVKGIVELATQLETSTGTSTTLVPTVKTVADTYIKKQFLNIGDILVSDAFGVESVLAKGNTGDVLTVDPTNTAQGLQWITPTTPKYVATLAFVADGADFKMDIPQTTHLKGLYPVVTVQEDVAGIFKDTGVVVETTATGDVTIKITAPALVGRVIIM